MRLLSEAAVFLAAAVVAVPLFRRLGLGSVLGYLVAGIVIGPWGLHLVGDVENVRGFAELGVVFLLFIIGLELQPSRLWVLRRSVFGLGGAQVATTTLVLAGLGMALGLPMPAAMIAGLGLSLSSTAFVLQMLAEKGQLTERHGRSAFAVLLFQDLAVIPVLALLPLFAPGASAQLDAGLWLRALGALKVLAALAVVVGGGRYLLRPFFRLVAAAGNQEVFAAAGLLVVIGTALLMQAIGLSMSLGAFLAGVLLADSEYRHQLEAKIEPFEGLLLGLFFISVGMAVDLGLLRDRPLELLALAAGLMTVKALLLWGLARVAGHAGGSAGSLAISLAQGGEFAFVLFALAVGEQLMAPALADRLIVVVTLSMALTPLLVAADERVRRSRREPAPPFDALDDSETPRVIIAGFGRFGQIVARILRLRRIPFTALEVSPTQVDFVRRYGNRIYYGDASKLDLLLAAKAGQAEVFVLAIDDVETSLRTAEMVKRHFPNLVIYARARNRFHAHRLMDIGVTRLIRETYLSSLELARSILMGLGDTHADASAAIDVFRAHDEATLTAQHAVYRDEKQLVQTSQDAARELEGLFEADARRERRLTPRNGSSRG
jgi:monovalent cation:proton antiporter-2 (CPA2) family protein